MTIQRALYNVKHRKRSMCFKITRNEYDTIEEEKDLVFGNFRFAHGASM